MEKLLYKNLGFHASPGDLPNFIDKFDVFQVFLMSPLKFQFEISQNVIEILQCVQNKFPNVALIAHSPFWYSLVNPSRLTKLSLKNLYMHVDVCNKLGIKKFVIHPGSLGKDSGLTRSGAAKNLFEMSFMLSKKLPIGFEICWENSASSVSGSKGLKTFELVEVIRQLRENKVDNIGLAFDTQHSYASGELVADFDSYCKVASVIHLNPNPLGVLHGSFKDKHTETALFESYGYGEDILMGIIKNYPDKIKIMECAPSVVLKNLEWFDKNAVANVEVVK